MADHPTYRKEPSDIYAGQIIPLELPDQSSYHSSTNIGKSDELEKCSNSSLNVAEECIQSFLHQGALNTMNEKVPEQAPILSVPIENTNLISSGTKHQDKTCIAEDTINSLLEVNDIVPESSVCDDRLSITAEDEAGCLSDARVISSQNTETGMKIPVNSISGLENIQLIAKALIPETGDDRLSITCEDTGDSEVKGREKKTLKDSKLQKSESEKNSSHSKDKGAYGSCEEKKESEGATAMKERRYKHHKKHSKKKKKKFRPEEKQKKKKKKKKEDRKRKDKSGESSRSREETSDGVNRQNTPKLQLSSVITQPSEDFSFSSRKSSSIYFAGKTNTSEDLKFKEITTVNKDSIVPGLSTETPDEFDDDWLSYSSEIKAAQMKTTNGKSKDAHAPEKKKKSDGHSRRKHSKERENTKKSYSSRKYSNRKNEKEIETNRRKRNSDDAKKGQRRISEEIVGSSPEEREIDARKRRSTVDTYLKEKKRKMSNTRDSDFQDRNDVVGVKEILDSKIQLDISVERHNTSESKNSIGNGGFEESSGKVKVNTVRKLADSPATTEKESMRKNFGREDHEGEEFIFDTKRKLDTSVEVKDEDTKRSSNELQKGRKSEKESKDKSKNTSIGTGEHENKGNSTTGLNSTASTERRKHNQPDDCVCSQENIDKEKSIGEEVKSIGIVQSDSHKEKIVLSLKPKRKAILKSASNNDWCKVFEDAGEQQNAPVDMFAAEKKVITVSESLEQNNQDKEETQKKQDCSLDMFAENEKRTSPNQRETHEESSTKWKETRKARPFSGDMFSEAKKKATTELHTKSHSLPKYEISETPLSQSTSIDMTVLEKKDGNESVKKDNGDIEEDAIEGIEKSTEKKENRANEKEATIECIGKIKEKKENPKNEKEDIRKIMERIKEKKENRKNEKENAVQIVGKRKEKIKESDSDEDINRKRSSNSKTPKQSQSSKSSRSKSTSKHKSRSPSHTGRRSLSKTTKKRTSHSKARESSSEQTWSDSSSADSSDDKPRRKSRSRTPKRSNKSKYKTSRTRKHRSRSSTPKVTPRRYRSRSDSPKKVRKYKKRSRSRSPVKRKKHVPRTFRAVSYSSSSSSTSWSTISSSPSPKVEKPSRGRSRIIRKSQNFSRSRSRSLTPQTERILRRKLGGKRSPHKKSKRSASFLRNRCPSKSPFKGRELERKSSRISPVRKSSHISRWSRSQSRSKTPKAKGMKRESRDKSPKTKLAKLSIEKEEKSVMIISPKNEPHVEKKSRSVSSERHLSPDIQSSSFDNILHSRAPTKIVRHSDQDKAEKLLSLPSASPQKPTIDTPTLKIMTSSEIGREDHKESSTDIKSTIRERSDSESAAPRKGITELTDIKLGQKLDGNTESKSVASTVLIIPEIKTNAAFQEINSTDVCQQPQQTVDQDVNASLLTSSNERHAPRKSTTLAPVVPDEKPSTIQQTQQSHEMSEISHLPKDVVNCDILNSSISLVTLMEKPVTMGMVVDKHDSMAKQGNITVPQRVTRSLDVSEINTSLERKNKLVSENMNVTVSNIEEKPYSNSVFKQTRTFARKDATFDLAVNSNEDSNIRKDILREQNAPQQIPRQSFEQAFERLPPPPPPPMPIPFRNVFGPLGRFNMPSGPPGPGFAPRVQVAAPLLRNVLPFQPNLETVPRSHVEASSFTPTNQIVNIPGLGLESKNDSESTNFGMQQQHQSLLGLPTSACVIPFLGDSDWKPTNGSSDEPATVDIIEDAGSPVDMDMSGSSPEPEVDIIEKMNEEFWKNEQNTLDEAYEPGMLPVFLDEPIEVSVSSGTRKKRLTKKVKKRRRKDLSGEKRGEPRTKVQVLLDKLHRQARVEEEVKIVLKEYYKHREIDKSEYKSILRRAVPQVANSTHSIDPERIRSLVKKYVAKAKGARGLPQS